MAQSLVITLREGLEAALIVSIVLAYLAKNGHREGFKSVWWGVAGAIVFSLAVGAGIFSLGIAFEGKAEEIFEGVAMFLAVIVLGWMVVWMKRQARFIKGDLEARVQRAVTTGSGMALMGVAFLAVAREGLETALFMFAANSTSTPTQTIIGGLVGLAIAVLLGVAIYRGSRALNLRTFFNITGVLLIFVAGGLLARGIHEFQEAGVLPMVIEHVWNTNSILNEGTGLGSFLKAVVGYNGNPSMLEVLAYALFLVVTIRYFFQVRTPWRKAGEVEAPNR